MISAGIFNKACNICKKSSMRHKLAAIIFKQNRILSIGWNDKRTCSKMHTKYRKYESTLHAEQHAISRIKDKNMLKGASIFVLRLGADASIMSLAKPCEYCEKSLRHYGIKHVFYSNNNNSISHERY